MTTIKDIDGNKIEVTDLKAAIQQCIDCSDSPYKMASGRTVGEQSGTLYWLRIAFVIEIRTIKTII